MSTIPAASFAGLLDAMDRAAREPLRLPTAPGYHNLDARTGLYWLPPGDTLCAEMIDLPRGALRAWAVVYRDGSRLAPLDARAAILAAGYAVT